MTSEIQTRADELRAIAKSCKTINDFARATGFSMEVARHTRDILALNLPDARLKAGPATEAKANPKSPKKAGK
jgi:hypothetical protein